MLIDQTRDHIDFAEPTPCKTVDLAPVPLDLERQVDPVDLVVSTAGSLEQISLPTQQESKFLGLGHRQWLTGAALAGGVNVFLNPAFTSLGVLIAGLGVAYPQLKKGKGSKLKLSLVAAAGVAFSTVLGVSLLSSSAQALFFEEAETFFETTFELSGEAVGVIFNIFRAMYVIYLIYSAISVWTSYQRDEDWMSVAKAPMVIFVGGTLIDVVASVIVA